jgi:hypothetical protein
MVATGRGTVEKIARAVLAQTWLDPLQEVGPLPNPERFNLALTPTAPALMICVERFCRIGPVGMAWSMRPMVGT